MVRVLNRGQIGEFAERGFLVPPRVVRPDVAAAASRAIDELIEREPPGPGVRGAAQLFPPGRGEPELAALDYGEVREALA